MEKKSLSDEWLAQIHADGYRITRSRRIIVEELATSQKALDPADLFTLCRSKDPGLGLVTVYRTLDQLELLGLIHRVHQPDGCHTIVRKQNGHEHVLICTSCGKAVTFKGDNFDNLSARVAAETGFAIQDHMLQLFGLCPECQKNNQEFS